MGLSIRNGRAAGSFMGLRAGGVCARGGLFRVQAQFCDRLTTMEGLPRL